MYVCNMYVIIIITYILHTYIGLSLERAVLMMVGYRVYALLYELDFSYVGVVGLKVGVSLCITTLLFFLGTTLIHT